MQWMQQNRFRNCLPVVQQLEVGLPVFRSGLGLCEAIYFDILVERLGSQLEHFNPNRFITMYLVDAIDGFQFEAFLV